MEYMELNSSCADSEASLRLEAKSEGDEALSSEGCGSSVGIGESLSTAGSGSARFFPLSRTFSAWCAGGPPAAGCGSGGSRDGLRADRMGVVVEVVVVAATVLLEARLLPRLAAAAAAAAAAA